MLTFLIAIFLENEFNGTEQKTLTYKRSLFDNCIACERQTYFRSSLLSLRKYVCGSQAKLQFDVTLFLVRKSRIS